MTGNNRRTLFRITRSNYGKEDKTVKIALDARKLNDSCVKKDRICQTWKNY